MPKQSGRYVQKLNGFGCSRPGQPVPVQLRPSPNLRTRRLASPHTTLSHPQNTGQQHRCSSGPSHTQEFVASFCREPNLAPFVIDDLCVFAGSAPNFITDADILTVSSIHIPYAHPSNMANGSTTSSTPRNLDSSELPHLSAEAPTPPSQISRLLSSMACRISPMNCKTTSLPDWVSMTSIPLTSSLTARGTMSRMERRPEHARILRLARIGLPRTGSTQRRSLRAS